MLRKPVVDLTIDSVLAFPNGLHHSIPHVVNPVEVVACPTDHPIGTTLPIQIIVALRADQFIPKCRAFQKTSGR